MQCFVDVAYHTEWLMRIFQAQTVKGRNMPEMNKNFSDMHLIEYEHGAPVRFRTMKPHEEAEADVPTGLIRSYKNKLRKLPRVRLVSHSGDHEDQESH